MIETMCLYVSQYLKSKGFNGFVCLIFKIIM